MKRHCWLIKQIGSGNKVHTNQGRWFVCGETESLNDRAARERERLCRELRQSGMSSRQLLDCTCVLHSEEFVLP